MMAGNRIRVLKPGFLTTVQDLGRFRHQRFGVPVSGALDTFACRAGNRLVGNHDSAAVLEMTVRGATVLFEADSVIAMTGADFSPRLDNRPLPLWQSVAVTAGTTLACGARVAGARAYLAVAGGLDVPLVFGSRATHVRSRTGGLRGTAVQTDDIVAIGSDHHQRPAPGRTVLPSHRPHYSSSPTLRVIRGRHAGVFSESAWGTLIASRFIVLPESDRMGYRLSGPPLPHPPAGEILSEAMPTGAIQVPPDQQPVLLMADHGTTGGYPKIAVVISADLPLAAQILPGDAVRFSQVRLEEAHALLQRQERALASF